MPTGPGKYDVLATLVRETTQADGVIVIVMGGILGSGFAVQTHEVLAPGKLATILEDMAKQIRESMG